MENLSEYINYYLISTALYTALYYLVAARCLPKFIPPFSKLTIDQSKEWISNSASIVTSLICGLGTLIGLLLKSDSDLKFRILQLLVTALTGYWVSDTLFRINNLHVLKNRRFQYFLLFHHFLGTIAVQIAVLHKEMMDAKLIFILMELGSLFINIRFCLLDLNFERSSPVYEGVSYAMIATFFVTRLLPIPYMYYYAGYKCVWTGEVCSAACRPFIAFNSVLYSIFTALNVYWFYVMLIGLIKHRVRKHLTAVDTQNATITTYNDCNTNGAVISKSDRPEPGSESCQPTRIQPLDVEEQCSINHGRDTLREMDTVTQKQPQAGGNVSDGVETLRRRNTGGSAIVETCGGANANINQGQGLTVKIAQQLDALGRSGSLLLDSNQSDKEAPSAESMLLHRKQTILE